MRPVSISRCPTYDSAQVEESLDRVLAPLGTMSAFVAPGQKVLLKVNLLAKAEPERAVTTHPELVRALIRSARSAGGIVTVGDSPGGPNTAGLVRGVFRTSGIAAVCAEENVPLVLFDDDVVRVSAADPSLYGSFTLGRAVIDTDVLISVPKFKTHGFMMFTGAVKNLFGCIPGLEKAQYHLKVPERDDFGSMLVDLMQACRPALAVMDAVVGMEGDGPAGGTPRDIGALIASADCVALDVVASSIAGLDPMEVYTNAAAYRRGIGPRSAEQIEVLGEDWRLLAPEDFALPAPDVGRQLPSWLKAAMRGWMLARPVLEDAEGCTRCATCAESCPVDAIVIGSDGPAFDRDTCIRCYCCQELCPPQVIGLKTPPIARLMTRKRNRR